MSAHPLEEILHPRSIAVVGASNSGGRGGGFVAPLQELGFKGDIYPVNPKYSEIMGLKAYARVRDIPGVVDYVISSIPAPQVPAMIDDCVQKGVKVVHLFTARFSETGRKDAAELEQDILRRAKSGGVRIIGPNCMGLYYPREGISFNNGMPKESGPVGLASQSGQAVGEIVFLADEKGLRFSKAISYGNALDFNECDYLEYFAQDPDTEIIMMYIEGVRDGSRFFDLLRSTAAVKPVIIVKGGRGTSGTRATASHTASLAGSMQVWETMVNQAGAVSARDLEELVDLATGFYYLPPIKGPRVGVAGGSGGSSVLAADICEEAGLDVIPLPVEIREKLKANGSPIWDWVGNPADFSIGYDDFNVGGMIQMMDENENFDFLILFMSGPWFRGGDMNINKLIEEHMKRFNVEDIKKPLLVVFQERGRGNNTDPVMQNIVNEIKKRLMDANIPLFSNIGRAASTANKLIEYYQKKK